jgi:hypothetical protein
MEASSRGEGAPDEALRRLEQRLDRASEAAERLMAQAAEAAARRAQGPRESKPAQGSQAPRDPGERAEPPPAGWQMPPSDGAGDSRSDLEVLTQVIHAVRELIPPELERRLLEALRELLLAVRALIDWYLERSEQRRSAPAQVQDIPIS